MRIELAPGTTHDLVLELSDREFTAEPPDPGQSWAATEQAWSDVSPGCDDLIALADARHSYAVLRGLTSASGAMVAAATTSLPERLEGGRNYDYRYAWIRDQCYAGIAVAAHGPHPLLTGTVRFVTERLLDDGPELMPAYTVAGEPIGDEVPVKLRGFPGGTARAGNWVRGQFQLDALGETLSLFAAAARLDLLAEDDWRAAAIAADGIGKRWNEPEAGLWELDNRRWTHSRLACVSGLRAIAAAAAVGPPGSHGHREAAQWSGLADTIAASLGDAVHPSGRWQRAPDDERVDAALLMPMIRGGFATMTRGTWPRPRRSAGNWRPTATSTASGTTAGRLTRPRARSCSAGSGWRWSSTPAATRSRPRTGSNATGARAAPPPSTPRSTTSTSASSAATCPRRSSTPPCSSARSPYPATSPSAAPNGIPATPPPPPLPPPPPTPTPNPHPHPHPHGVPLGARLSPRPATASTPAASRWAPPEPPPGIRDPPPCLRPPPQPSPPRSPRPPAKPCLPLRPLGPCRPRPSRPSALPRPPPTTAVVYLSVLTIPFHLLITFDHKKPTIRA